ncbi:MAG: hypothetical protein LC772_06860 [Chloroflexi bacterium]|nr:hypothetical protein [Chloroflexota bacterium]
MSKERTLGPWQWLDEENGIYYLGGPSSVVLTGEIGAMGARLFVRNESDPASSECSYVPVTPGHPDARLIAAAPGLLMACRIALLQFEQKVEPTGGELIALCRLRRAIRQATT